MYIYIYIYNIIALCVIFLVVPLSSEKQRFLAFDISAPRMG